MNPIIDIIMVLAFVIFLVFIFSGYHKSKLAQREKEKEEE